MLECLILGDSIAVGTEHYHNQYHKPLCELVAKNGYNTWQWNKKFGEEPLSAKTVVISLGTNDHLYINTEQELRKIRVRVNAYRVYWIVPAIKPDIQEVVKKIAREYGDFLVPINHLHTDRIHPSVKGYRDIARILH